MKIHSPRKVKVLPDYKLSITFENGEKRIFDVKPYLEDSFFAPLKNIAKFQSIRINPITIEWDGGIDICPDELYHNSTPLAKNINRIHPEYSLT
jgi:hypothetical protein